MRRLVQAFALDERDLSLAAFSQSEVSWIVASGLGPLLVEMLAHDSQASNSPFWAKLKASEFTAQVLTSTQAEAAAMLIDHCSIRGVPLTLLKGISVAQLYPKPHLRPMRDIDVLVPASFVADTTATLREIGYIDDPHAAPGFYEGHHHAVPLVHPRTGVWVEVHHRLFPIASDEGCPDPFAPVLVNAGLVAADFHGREVLGLGREFEIPYVAAHWARSSKPIGQPGGVIAMLDLIVLAKRTSAAQWASTFALVNGSSVGVQLGMLLSYLSSRRLADLPRPVTEGLPRLASRLGRWTWPIVHQIVDRHILQAPPVGRFANRRARVLWKLLTTTSVEM